MIHPLSANELSHIRHSALRNPPTPEKFDVVRLADHLRAAHMRITELEQQLAECDEVVLWFSEGKKPSDTAMITRQAIRSKKAKP